MIQTQTAGRWLAESPVNPAGFSARITARAQVSARVLTAEDALASRQQILLMPPKPAVVQ